MASQLYIELVSPSPGHVTNSRAMASVQKHGVVDTHGKGVGRLRGRGGIIYDDKKVV